IACLEPLIQARRHLGGVCVLGANESIPSSTSSLLEIGGRPPASIFTSLSNGKHVPIGWLPGEDHKKLTCYAQTAAEIVKRKSLGLGYGPVALLGQWQTRIITLMDDLEPTITLPRFRWTAERLVRRDLVKGLACGPGVALYCGHGQQTGWLGYGGVSASMLLEAKREPLGVVLSIACKTGCHDDHQPSFCEDLTLRGYCGAAFGAIEQTCHEDNRRLASRLCGVLGTARVLGEALKIIAGPGDTTANVYRILGDPAAPFIGARDACTMAAQVFAPAPNDLVNAFQKTVRSC